MFYTYYALTLQFCAGLYTSQTCFFRKVALYNSFIATHFSAQDRPKLDMLIECCKSIMYSQVLYNTAFDYYYYLIASC